MRRWHSWVLWTVMVGMGVSARAQDKDRFEPGEEVPVFTLKAVNSEDLGGDQKYISIDRYYGSEAEEPKKLVMLSFFATYCEPCKKEMPYLAALHQEYGPKGLQILSITIDKEADKVDFAKTLAKDSGVKFPVLSDRFNIVAKRYFISKLPCVYLINSEGKVAMVNVGYNEDISKNILSEIRKGVGEPKDAPVPPSLAVYLNGHGAAAPAGEAAAVASAETAAEGAEQKAEGESEAEADDGKGKKKKKKAAAKASGKKKRRKRK